MEALDAPLTVQRKIATAHCSTGDGTASNAATVGSAICGVWDEDGASPSCTFGSDFKPEATGLVSKAGAEIASFVIG